MYVSDKTHKEVFVERCAILLASGLGLIVLVGCAGKGEVIPMHVQASDSAASAKAKEVSGPSVAVTVFEDSRAEKTRLGTRTHLWGGESYFNVPGGKAGEVAAQAVADYLKSKGWRAELVKPGGSVTESSADIMLSGKLLALSVDAKGKYFKTELSTKTKIVIQALNRADGSKVSTTLRGEGTEEVFWFDPEDAQGLMNEVFTASLEKLLADTKVENNLLRLKES